MVSVGVRTWKSSSSSSFGSSLVWRNSMHSPESARKKNGCSSALTFGEIGPEPAL